LDSIVYIFHSFFFLVGKENSSGRRRNIADIFCKTLWKVSAKHCEYCLSSKFHQNCNTYYCQPIQTIAHQFKICSSLALDMSLSVHLTCLRHFKVNARARDLFKETLTVNMYCNFYLEPETHNLKHITNQQHLFIFSFTKHLMLFTKCCLMVFCIQIFVKQ